MSGIGISGHAASPHPAPITRHQSDTPAGMGEYAPVQSEENAATSITSTDYAQSKRELMNLINEIRAMGASLELDLPVIVVAGNQSSGKSSLMEAISGLKLPRASGTCTRVPMEVRLRQEPDKEWQCQISLRFETDEHGTALDNISEKPFGPVIYERAHVENALLRAQLAILNPSIDPSHFVSSDDVYVEQPRPLGSQKTLPFSKNVVCLDVAGPDATDVTLIDLPGLIQSVAKGEDPASIALVEDLAKHYIQKDCLILLTITMMDDIQNQRAVMLASQVDPEGKRTIGVLTKADTVRGREHDAWLKILHGEKNPLLHGYYVTRQPTADELAEGISSEVARAMENDFFGNFAPWSTLEPKVKARLGTDRLTSFLSDQLMLSIRSKLPDLISKIHETYEAVSAELKELPPIPSEDPASEMLKLLNTFVHEVEAFVEGARRHEQLIQELKPVYLDFKKKIWATAPRFTPFTTAETTGNHERRALLTEDFIAQIDGIRDRDMGDSGSDVPCRDLSDVRRDIEKSITRELPNNVPFPAKISLIEYSTSTWSKLAQQTVDQVRPIVEQLVERVIAKHFGRYTEGRLPTTVQSIARQQIQQLLEKTERQTLWLVGLDATPFTMNAYDFDELRVKIHDHLKDKRYPKAKPAGPNKVYTLENALANLAGLGYTGLKEADLKKLCPADNYETELEVMAETRAYFQLAYKRVIDNLPRAIDVEFIKPLSSALHDALILELAIASENNRERCAKLLAESPATTAKRAELEQRKRRLSQAKEAIAQFGMSGSSGSQ